MRFVMLVAFLLALMTVGYCQARWVWLPAARASSGPQTMETVLTRLQGSAEKRLRSRFLAAGVTYPPQRLTLIGLKAEHRLEVWADDGAGWTRVLDYAVLAESGHAGPKLREGDRQIPEGFYQIESLNPNSAYHLSLKLNFPNAFDWQQARREGRSQPGSDIFIHGKAVSVGCLAIGDTAIEELFVLVARIWPAEVTVLMLPNDLRVSAPITAPQYQKVWLPPLYERLEQALQAFR